MTGASFPLTLKPGQTATLTLSFEPTATGAVTGAVALTTNTTAGSATITLSGTGSQSGTGGSAQGTLRAVSCSSASMTGAGTDACAVTLTNSAGAGGLAVSLSSSNAAVSVPTSVTVPAGASSAAFTATVSATTTAQTATLTATVAGITKTYAIALGAAAPGLTLSSSSIAFGDVTLKSPSTQSVVLTSSGTAPLTISAGSVTGTGFGMTGTSFPVTLNPGSSVTLEVAFDPTASGSASGAVTLKTNTTAGSATISLSGTGQSVSYTVNLSWNAPSSSTVSIVGYNIYRETSGGSSYQRLNSTVDPETAYTDSTVADGTTYSYYVESVDSSGNVSAPSTPFTIAVP